MPMARVIFTHLYVIIVATLVVMTGNILADQYGPSIKKTMSDIVYSVDHSVNNVEETVTDWNKKILN
jgi:ubiquinone biosynthesis protein UbiJ